MICRVTGNLPASPPGEQIRRTRGAALNWNPDSRQPMVDEGQAGNGVRLWNPDSGCQIQPTLYHFKAPGSAPSWATIDHDVNRVIACGPDAWRSLGWLAPDPDTGLRWLPAEYFGSLPLMQGVWGTAVLQPWLRRS